MSTIKYRGPVVLAVLDGFGLRRERPGNAIKQASLPFLEKISRVYPSLSLEASGPAVGLAPGQMGNSEVGHLTMGTGQIIPQVSTMVDQALSSGVMWQSAAWQAAMQQLKQYHSTLHFAGIFSDGGVHSHIDHLFAMIRRAHEEGITKIRIHAVLDGRDVSPQSAEQYLAKLQALFAEFPDADYKIASGGGRMVFVADRYGNDWSVVKAGWDAIVHGRAPRQFSDPIQAVETLRSEQDDPQDQYLPPFVICQNDRPVGPVIDQDVIIYFDFRADRAVEISEAFTATDFSHFDRGHVPETLFVGMSEYDVDRHLPANCLVMPSSAELPLNQFLAQRQVSQLALSETVKFGHITYYFNGASYQPATLESHLEVSSDTAPFNTRPWMKSAEITDLLLENIEKYQFIRVNYPGADMVGHFGELYPTKIALEAIDLQLSRLATALDALGGVLLITADHGNAEELIDAEGLPKTSHTLNPVPLIFYDNTNNRTKYQFTPVKSPGIANIAATIAVLLGQSNTPHCWQPPLIQLIPAA